MELVIRLILIFAFIDFLLTLLWIYRWRSASYLKIFKKRIPVKLFEANIIVNHFIKNFGLYPGATLGYFLVVTIQIALANLHWIMAWIIFMILIWAILGHIKNNLTTTEKYIVKITKAYNKKLERN